MVILHASFIITGLVQLRERARGHLVHTRSIVHENTAVHREKVFLFGFMLQGVWFSAEGVTHGNMAVFNVNADLSWLRRIIREKDI